MGEKMKKNKNKNKTITVVSFVGRLQFQYPAPDSGPSFHTTELWNQDTVNMKNKGLCCFPSFMHITGSNKLSSARRLRNKQDEWSCERITLFPVGFFYASLKNLKCTHANQVSQWLELENLTWRRFVLYVCCVT